MTNSNLKPRTSTLKPCTSNLKPRPYNPLKILGSTVNMVDIPFITEWITEQIDGYDRCEVRGIRSKVRGPRSEVQGSEPQPSNLAPQTLHLKPNTSYLEFSTKQLIVTGFHGLNQARKDPGYYRIGQECDLWVPDSIAPVLIAKKRGMKHVVRTPGAEIMTAFLERANERGFKSYFYGDSETTLSALRKNLEKRYPGHEVAGTFSPPFRPLNPEEEQEHIDMINDAQPDVLWVGLGLPKQDEWIYRCKDRLKVPVAAGVGAAFGFLAGTVQRAPDWICMLGLEWLYMIMKKPKRTGKRVFVDGREFLWHVLVEEV